MAELTTPDILEILQVKPAKNEHPFEGLIIGECLLSGLQQSNYADFRGATFNCVAHFEDAEFLEGASFLNSTFNEDAQFSRSKFRGPAFFWRSHFKKNASFRRFTVSNLAREESSLYPGETNFSYARFCGDADFKRGRFGGRAFFHRTSFRGIADFEEARFDDIVKFDGLISDICLAADELPDPTLRERLLIYELLIPNTDYPEFYNFDPRIKSERQLKETLERERFRILNFDMLGIEIKYRPKKRSQSRSPTPSVQFKEQEITAIEELRQQFAQPLFSKRERTSFVRTEFVRRAIFSEVDLSRTLFQQANLDKVQFVGVVWAQLPLTFGLGKRAALHDESVGNVGNDRSLLEEAYHEIRMTYQRRGEIDIARDFYYGELEMIYRSKSPFRRWFSLSSLYRHLCGFGRQEGLAGQWLLFFVVLLFPALYFVTDRTPVLPLHPKIEKILRAELHSLEACTFIARDPKDTYTNSERLVAGMERLCVVAQAGLFILATKWKFERNPGSS